MNYFHQCVHAETFFHVQCIITLGLRMHVSQCTCWNYCTHTYNCNIGLFPIENNVRDLAVSYDHLHNNSNVVSEITFPEFAPPNRTIILNSPPTPNTTAECPHCGVISAGRVTCRMMGKHF